MPSPYIIENDTTRILFSPTKMTVTRNASLKLCGRTSSSSFFGGMITVNKLTTTHPLVIPSSKDIDVNPESGSDVEDVHVMSEETTRVLWHERF